MKTVAELEKLLVETPTTQMPELIGLLATLQAKAHLKMVSGQGPTKEQDGVLTIPEVAERLKISEYRAYELCRKGEIKKTSIGTRSVRVKPEDLAAYLARVGG